MEWHEIESHLADLAERLQVEVRHLRYEGEGGLCVIRGKRVLVINDLLDAPERVALMAKALAGLPEIENIFIVPEIRELLRKYAMER